MDQRSSFALAVGVLSIVIFGCGASTAQQINCTTAEFTVPDEPSSAVLHLTATGLDMTVRSLTLYGDGRVELSDDRTGRYKRLVEFTEVESVRSGAVESLDDARQLVNGAADVTKDRLGHIWAKHIVGTAGSQEESKSLPRNRILVHEVRPRPALPTLEPSRKAIEQPPLWRTS